MAEPDEVVLEADLGPRRAQCGRLGQHHPGAQRVVGHGHQMHRNAAPACQFRRDGAQWSAVAQAARPEEMGGQIAVAQAEPVVPSEPPQLVHDRPALAGHAPTGLAVVHAGQGVGDGVEVGADGKAVQLHVVADIDDRGNGVGRYDADQTCEHSSGPDAAAQGHQHVVSIGAPGGGPFPPPLVPSPPAMPVRIPSDQHETVVSVLREAARVNGDVEAYVEPDVGGGRRRLTFAEWDRAADGVAGHLARLGVAKGDVVCLLLPSSIDYAVLYGGLLRLGAITSGINPRMGAGEVASILDRAAPVLLVVDPEAGGRLDAGTTAVVTRAETRHWWDEQGPDHVPQLASSDPVAVVWTSGTTGRPKGALFDHANLAAVARGTDVLSHPGDRRLSPLPFAHVGYMTRAWDEIGNAVTTIITPTPWRADEAIRVMADEGVTVAQGVPTQWALMLASDALAAGRPRRAACRRDGRGAHDRRSMVAEVRRRFGVPVVVRYTSTESSLGTGTTLTSTDEEVATTVGRPVAGVELAIVDDEGDPAPAGTVGRVLLRSRRRHAWLLGSRPGPRSVAGGPGGRHGHRGVLGPDGWLTTGDFGRLTPEGNLQLSGRAHERYIRGGYNVYPAEVEEALSSHPAVARVAVVGVPDDVLGEVGVAVVVAVAGEPPDLASLRAHCARVLSDYKAPDALVLVDELPLTPMMKVDPVRLAALAADGAEERRLALERSRRTDAGVLGNGPTGEEDEKERA